MNVHYPIQPDDGTHRKRFVPHDDQINHTISLINNTHAFEILKDEQVVTLMYAGFYTANIPVCSVNGMLHNTAPQIIPPNEYFNSGYVNRHPIRNIYNL